MKKTKKSIRIENSNQLKSDINNVNILLPSSFSEEHRINRWLFLPVLLLFLTIFASIIFQNCQFCARDSANFYYPLFQQIQNEWNDGHFPGWDPYENLGQPLAANPTASVFYPAKILFFLPKISGNAISYDFCFKYYILLHYFIAFFGMFKLLRSRKASSAAATFAATAYTFSGPVLYQYCNLIFLIGAALFPWGILAGLNLLKKRSLPALVLLATVLALTILGGEPQTAYFIGIALIIFVLVDRKHQSIENNQNFDQYNKDLIKQNIQIIKTSQDIQDTQDKNKLNRQLCSAENPILTNRRTTNNKKYLSDLLLLLAAAILAALLAAVQLIPGFEMTRDCDRISQSAPLSIWSLPQSVLSGTGSDPLFSNFLCQNMSKTGHQRSIYNFSLSPWRTMELIWPNCGGDYTNRSDRWFSLFPQDEELWTATIYPGGLTLCFALAGIFLMKRRRKNNDETVAFPRENESLRRFACWIFLGALLASFGGFGLGWLLRAVKSCLFEQQNLLLNNGDPIGGIYWLMNLLLPGFSIFRYPAKLMTPAIFALALLAGLSFDTILLRLEHFRLLRAEKKKNGFNFIFNSTQKKIAFFGIVLIVLSLIGFIITTFYFRLLNSCGQGFLQPIILGILFFAVILFVKRRALVPVLILLLLCLDLYSANARYVHSVPENFYKKTPLIALSIQEDRQKKQSDYGNPNKNQLVENKNKSNESSNEFNKNIDRVYRWIEWNPAEVLSDPNRIQLGAGWDKKTLAPKFSFPLKIGVANAQGTIINAEYARFIRELDQKIQRNPADPDLPKIFQKLGINYFILPYRTIRDKKFELPETELMNDRTPKLSSFLSDTETFLKNINSEWPQNTLLWKLKEPIPQIRILGKRSGKESISVLLRESNRIIFEVNLQEAGEIEIAEQFWTGWQARELERPNSAAIPVEKSAGIFRKIALPAGRHKIVMFYAPNSFRYGIVVSLLAVLLFGIAALIYARHGDRKSAYRQEQSSLPDQK